MAARAAPLVESLQAALEKPILIPQETPAALLAEPENMHGSTKWVDRGGKTANNSLTESLERIRKILNENRGCVCLVQVGSFYELYFEQATLIAPKLGIKCALRKTKSHSVPMAGFPLPQLRKYVKMLVHDLHLTVAIVDQVDSGRSKDLKLRKVSRIITPGTLVDESFMNYAQNNYLAAVSFPKLALAEHPDPDPDMEVGVLWADISVGDFYVQKTTLGDLAGDLRRINPSEVILHRDLQPRNAQPHWLTELADLRKYFVRYHKTTYGDSKVQLRSDLMRASKALEDLSVREESAMNMVLSYAHINLPDRPLLLDMPVRYVSDRYLSMDSRTRDALELTGRATFGSVSVVGSLLNTIKRTVTASGSRVLTQWIKLPIVDKRELQRRQSYVAMFINAPILRLRVRSELSLLEDFVRALQRLALRSGTPLVQLQSIGEGIQKLQLLRAVLEESKDALRKEEQALLDSFLQGFAVPSDLATLILDAIHVERIVQATPAENSDPELELQLSAPVDDDAIGVDIYRKDSTSAADESFEFTIKREYNPELLSLHEQLAKLVEVEEQILNEVRTAVNAIDPRATVERREQVGRQFNCIYISCKARTSQQIYELVGLKDDYREKRAASLVYKPSRWAQIAEQRVHLMSQIIRMEKIILESLREQVLGRVAEIRAANRCADLLDITSSFALLAEENGWVCPKLVKSPSLKIQKGRHAVVESSLKASGQLFTPNDTDLGSDGTLWVISGPNMGGKSTFLRQNALMVILAQIGSYVPASAATMGIADRLFTRIGASDDIFSDLSTFMVEMLETSNILKNATLQSLAIVDEIGRGTSGKEGLAIAYATLVSLLVNNKCRALFATHFGREIKELLEKDGVDQKRLRFYRTKVVEKTDRGTSSLLFDHSLEPGITDRSYAFEVAKLAGFPEKSLGYARRALAHLG